MRTVWYKQGLILLGEPFNGVIIVPFFHRCELSIVIIIDRLMWNINSIIIFVVLYFQINPGIKKLFLFAYKLPRILLYNLLKRVLEHLLLLIVGEQFEHQ